MAVLTRPPADQTPRRRPPATSGLLASNLDRHRASASTPPAVRPGGSPAGGALPRNRRDEAEQVVELLARVERLEEGLRHVRNVIGDEPHGMSVVEWLEVVEHHALSGVRHVDRERARLG